MQIKTRSAAQTQRVAHCLAQILTTGIWVRLDGDLGAGKTTFTQGLGRALGIQRAIKSPTYTIIKEYPLEHGNLVHVDAYRLEEGGADTVDLAAYTDAQSIVLIEWAQFIESELPDSYLQLQLTYGTQPDERLLTVSVIGQDERYQHLVELWQRACMQDLMLEGRAEA